MARQARILPVPDYQPKSVMPVTPVPAAPNYQPKAIMDPVQPGAGPVIAATTAPVVPMPPQAVGPDPTFHPFPGGPPSGLPPELSGLQQQIQQGMAMFGQHAPQIGAGLQTIGARVRAGLAGLPPGSIPANVQPRIDEALAMVDRMFRPAGPPGPRPPRPIHGVRQPPGALREAYRQSRRRRPTPSA